MVIVEIEKSGDMTLGKWFSELRSWFDHNHCQPTLFNQSERVIDKIIFNIIFSDENQAQLFASTFARYAPSIDPPEALNGPTFGRHLNQR